jgi:predicted naringenin-chalcone synthase
LSNSTPAARTTGAEAVSVVEPALALPPHLVDQEEVISTLAQHFADVPHLDRGLDLMRHTTVRNRPLLAPITELVKGASFGERNSRYGEEVVRLGVQAAEGALRNAGIAGSDVDYLVVVSCTGYMLPGPDAYIAQEIGCRPTVRRTPIQQMGCAAGVSALAEAFHFVRAYPDAQALVVAVELSSLSFQPEQSSLSDFISAAIFSDGAAAAVVRRGRNDPGFQIHDALQHLLPDSTDVIRGDTSENGFHFKTDPRVRRTVARVIPALTTLVRRQGWQLEDVGFCVSHTGGPLVMDGVEQGLRLAPGTLAPSRQSLTELGNPSSVSVYDVLSRHHRQPPADGSRGLMVAFGPGFTTEALIGTWREGPRPEQIPAASSTP